MGRPDERLQRGKDAFCQVYGAGAADTFLARRAGLGEDLARFGLEFNFGDVNARPGIDLATRELLTLATLIGLGGADPQVAGHTRAALRLGVPPAQLAELVIHCVQYVGFPRAINAMAVLRETLSQCGVDVSMTDPPVPPAGLGGQEDPAGLGQQEDPAGLGGQEDPAGLGQQEDPAGLGQQEDEVR